MEGRRPRPRALEPDRLERSRVRHVGGGFGCKLHQYPEDIVVPWLAMRSGRPVRWIEDRAEHLMTSIHAREQRMDLEAAYDADGRIRALRGTKVH